MAAVEDDLILRGDLVLPLATAPSTASPAIMDGYTALRLYKSGATIVLQWYDPAAGAWRSLTAS